MLLCKEQKREFIINGRIIRISDKAANAFYTMMETPLTDEEVSTYISASQTKTFLEDILESFTADELSKIVEEGIRKEFFDLYGTAAEKMWKSALD